MKLTVPIHNVQAEMAVVPTWAIKKDAGVPVRQKFTIAYRAKLSSIFHFRISPEICVDSETCNINRKGASALT